MTTLDQAREALREMVYETTHLSPMEPDGSHKCRISANVLAKARAALSAIEADGGADDSHAFKNFHRLLCERFDYTHDEKDWRRDQVSLIEWIARRAPLSASVPEDVEPVACGFPDPSYSDCPNMKEVGGGFEGERYRCDVCGKGYFLDYEDMK